MTEYSQDFKLAVSCMTNQNVEDAAFKNQWSKAEQAGYFKKAVTAGDHGIAMMKFRIAYIRKIQKQAAGE